MGERAKLRAKEQTALRPLSAAGAGAPLRMVSSSILRWALLARMVAITIAVITPGMFVFAQSVGTAPPADEFSSVSASAAAARDSGDVAQAIELYTQAEALNPKWPDGWWFVGTMRYGADEYAPARDALTRYIELTPNAGPALALRGLCEFETGQYPESLQDLQRGIALGAANQPRNAQIIVYHQALLLTRLGKYEEALGSYPPLLKDGAANPDLAIAVGLAGLRMPVFPKDMDPAQTELISMVGRAAIAMMTHDLTGGQQGFEEIFTRYPKTPAVHYLYGYLLFTTNPDQANVQFREELTVSPHSAIAHAMRAWASELQGEYAEALPDAEKAAAEDSSLPMGQLVYGRALVETGDVHGGLPHLERVLQLEPENLEAHMTLAKTYSKLGRSEDARRERQLCLAISDQSSGRGVASNATP